MTSSPKTTLESTAEARGRGEKNPFVKFRKENLFCSQKI